MTTNTPTLITIKLLASTAPSVKDVQAALAEFGTTLQYEAVNLVFNGTALVPAPAAEAPSAPPVAASAPKAPAKKGGRKPGALKIEVTPEGKRKDTAPTATDTVGKPINFEEGSDPAKIWTLIRTSQAMTSTQIREKLGLGSNIVNTTIYRLKRAGMVRPMSYSAANGDTLYTSTEWDPTPVAMPPLKTAPEGDVRELLSALGEAAANEYTENPDEDDESDMDAF